MKHLVTLLARVLAASPLRTFVPLLVDGCPHLLRVLTYHRVYWPTGRPDLSPITLSATPSDFELQMECLAKHFHVVDIDYAEARNAPQPKQN